jgi:hypothetical protein
LSKADVISFICLKLETASEMAIEIYNYRIMKKVSNSEKSIEKTSGLGGFDFTDFFFVLVVLVGLVDLALDLEALAIPPAFPLSHFSSDLLMVIEKPIQTNLRHLSLNFISLHSTSLNDTKFKASCKADALPISSSLYPSSFRLLRVSAKER